MTKQALVIALKYGLGLGLLAFVVYTHWHNTEYPELGLDAALARPINWQALAVTHVLCTVSILITFVRWYVLVRAQDLPFTAASALRLGLIGLYWNTFLPGSVGGDIIKAAFITREQTRRTAAVATVLLDRVIGLCGLIWLVTLLGTFLNMIHDGTAAAMTPDGRAVLRGILLTATGLSAASLVFWIVMGFFSEPWATRMADRLERIPRIGMSVAELWRATWMYRRRGKSVGLALGLSIVSHSGFVLTFYFAAQVLSPASLPSLQEHCLIVPMGMTGQALFPTPGGVGGAEWVFGWLYQAIGFAFVTGALGSLAQRVVMWMIAFLGYLVYFRMKTAAAPTGSADSA